MQCSPIARERCTAAGAHSQKSDLIWMLTCELLSDVAAVVGGLIVDDPDAADSDLHQCAVNGFSKGVRGVVTWDDNGNVRCAHACFRRIGRMCREV